MLVPSKLSFSFAIKRSFPIMSEKDMLLSKSDNTNMKQEKKKKRTAIIIGSGVGGTATAARLAVAGFDVTVLERNSFTGGRCSLIHHQGHRFDQGNVGSLSLSRPFAAHHATNHPRRPSFFFDGETNDGDDDPTGQSAEQLTNPTRSQVLHYSSYHDCFMNASPI